MAEHLFDPLLLDDPSLLEQEPRICTRMPVPLPPALELRTGGARPMARPRTEGPPPAFSAIAIAGMNRGSFAAKWHAVRKQQGVDDRAVTLKEAS